MSMTKDMYMAAVEQVGDDYAADKLTLEEAIGLLLGLGFGPLEAKTMLDEAAA